jgi:hypothetical protein
MYYVSFPKTGKTESISKSDVPVSDVQIENLPEKRKLLFDEWKSANEKLKNEREIDKKLKESQAQAEIMEKKRLDALAAEERKEQERIAELEEERVKREKLGKSAEALLAKESQRFSSNLKLADHAEEVRLKTELDAAERLLRVVFVKSTADPLHDAGGEAVRQIQAKISEIELTVKERVELNNRNPGDPGYSISMRKDAAVKTLVDQGWLQTEAEAAVEDMIPKGLLPDPKPKLETDEKSRRPKYLPSVRKAAAITSLVELGWSQGDALTAVESILEKGALREPLLTSVNNEKVPAKEAPTDTAPALGSQPVQVPLSDISYKVIVDAFARIESEPGESRNRTTAQFTAEQERRTIKTNSVETCLIGLRVQWRGWVDNVNSDNELEVDMDVPYDGRTLHIFETWYVYGPEEEVTFKISPEKTLLFDRGECINFEGTISKLMVIGGRVYELRLTDVSQITPAKT